MPVVSWCFSRAGSLLQGGRVHLWSGRLAFALAFEVYAPSRGRVQVLRSGQPGMDAGLAAYGHGWPIAAGPVGASLLAINGRTPRGVRLPASSLTTIVGTPPGVSSLLQAFPSNPL